MGRFYIQAYNIHNGGGKTLLLSLLRTLPNDIEISGLLDERLKYPDSLEKQIIVKRVSPTITSRLQAELWLKKKVKNEDIVFCFGSLPPLLKLDAKIIVFVQNRYLIEDVTLSQFSWKDRLRISVERIWLKFTARNVAGFVVQSPSMKQLLLKHIDETCLVRVLPYCDRNEGYQRTKHCDETVLEDFKFDFVYIASGEPHKNHIRLIEAWCLLAEENLFPSLCLTISKNKFDKLSEFLEKKIKEYDLKIENKGIVAFDQVSHLYSNSQSLIFPSVLESFGLPLIEARKAGISVIASELDFVRDVLDPEESFDPLSAISIARAVKRYMKIDEPPLDLLNGSEFVDRIIKGEY